MNLIRQAAILCGGRGTRLGKLTDRLPKPLVDVGGRPFLDYLLETLARARVSRILLLGGYKGELIHQYAALAHLRFGFARMDVSIEPYSAGTGGAVWHARYRLDDEFLLLNGDTLFDVDYNELEEALVPKHLGMVIAMTGEDSGGVYVCRSGIVNLLGVKSSLEHDLIPYLEQNKALERVHFDDRYFVDIGTPPKLERARRELPLRRAA